MNLQPPAPPAPGSGLSADPNPSPWLFHKLRWSLFVNSWRTLIGHSLVRPLTILLVSLVVWAFVFVVSYGGFNFIKEGAQLPLNERVVGLFLSLLFLALGAMLIFSTGLILYGSLFTAAETNFLLSRPVPADRVFAYKFQGAIAFSSWAFLLLGAPILIAYGLVGAAPWYFYLFLPAFFLGYVLLPGSLGALGCLLLVNFVPRRRKQVLALVVLLLLAAGGLWLYRLGREAREGMATDPGAETAAQMLYRISFTGSLWTPSSWVSRGLQAAGRGEPGRSGYYLALVWSNGLFLYLLVTWASVKLYRRGYNLLSTGGDLRRKHGGAWLDRALETVLPFIDPRTRLLIVKDFRTFRRDPQQWGQVVLFTGLLVLYFASIRRMFSQGIDPPYQNGVSFLNLSAIALLLCSYTGRFIYPLLSLEGRKFWILGLLPLKREQLLWGKFAFATTGGLVLSLGLVLLSDLMLEMTPDVMVLHVLTVIVLAAGLSGLSVGLGAVLPNFRETDPSKIAVGFGGTLNLVAGLAFLLLTLALMSGPWHAFTAASYLRGGGEVSFWMVPVVVVGALAGIVIGGLAVLLPLQAGIRALRRMEF